MAMTTPQPATTPENFDEDDYSIDDYSSENELDFEADTTTKIDEEDGVKGAGDHKGVISPEDTANSSMQIILLSTLACVIVIGVAVVIHCDHCTLRLYYYG